MAETEKLGFFAKIKLLFKIKKPAMDMIDVVQTAPDKWKRIQFWITLLGTLGSTAAALTGIIPPAAQLIAVTVIQALYNILRGAEKAGHDSVKGTFRTTELYLTGFSEIQKAFVGLQAGGVNPEWFGIASTVVGMALAAGQNLAARAPVEATTPSSPVPPPNS